MWSWIFGNSVVEEEEEKVKLLIDENPVHDTTNEVSILEWKEEEENIDVSPTSYTPRNESLPCNNIQIPKRTKKYSRLPKSEKRMKARKAAAKKTHEDDDDEEEGTVHVYCFHGRGQTMDQCEYALSSFTQKIKESAQRKWFFHYRQGFYRSMSGGFTWYPSTDTPPNDDFFQSRIKLLKSMEKRGCGTRDTVVLLGFGEGAAFALDLAYCFRNDYRPGWLCGVVAVAPPLLPHVPLSKKFTRENPAELCNIPTCLITSPRDKTVPMEKSLRWRALYTNTKTWIHDLGHYMPLHLTDIQEPILSFLEIQNEHREARDSEEEEETDCEA